jgi:hypothetical protein
MSFDTTSANTGRFRGACVLFEKQIGRELLWLACRHHVMELILAKVFTVCFGSSSCPEIRIFMPFKSVWNDVIRSNYRGLELQPGTVFVESTISFLKDVEERETQIRDDYRELIELTMILLGIPSTTIHWRARWMAKLLYAMKIFLFRDQQNIFKLTTINETQLPPEDCNTNVNYQQGKERIQKLRVVNDTVERGVRLFHEFNNLLTHDEEEKQLILQVVEANNSYRDSKEERDQRYKAVMKVTGDGNHSQSIRSLY